MIWLHLLAFCAIFKVTVQVACSVLNYDPNFMNKMPTTCTGDLCYFVYFEATGIFYMNCLSGYKYEKPSCIWEYYTSWYGDIYYYAYVCYCNHVDFCNEEPPEFTTSSYWATQYDKLIPLVTRTTTICETQTYIRQLDGTLFTPFTTGTIKTTLCRETGSSIRIGDAWKTTFIESALHSNTSDSLYRIYESLMSFELRLYESCMVGFQFEPTIRNMTYLCYRHHCNNLLNDLFVPGNVSCIMADSTRQLSFEEKCLASLCVLFYNSITHEYKSGCLWQDYTYAKARYEVGEYSSGAEYRVVICAETDCNKDYATATASYKQYVPIMERFENAVVAISAFTSGLLNIICFAWLSDLTAVG